MVLSGLATLVSQDIFLILLYYTNVLCVQNQTKLASSLQTAYNLRVLATLVQGLLVDLSQAMEDRIRGTFDLNKISKDAVSRGMSM